ncbi:MAG: DUF1800 family protein, partial [Deltaproteobacteria bacterium]|nr:DUF1800 family protein [Deltaproteobacteria bacterium]
MPASDPLDRSDAAHLLRRAAFGATDKELDKYEASTRAQVVASLLGSKPRKGRGPGKKGDSSKDRKKLQGWWLRRMLKVKEAANEKLVLFLHDHIPSSLNAVGDVGLLARQNETFRKHGQGSFRDLLIEVTRDPAMLEFLD